MDWEEVRYQCDQCGACCQGHACVPIIDVDILREPHLATAIKNLDPAAGFSELLSELRDPILQHCITEQNSPCKFLKENFKCAVYSTRPTACVAFAAGSNECQAARQAEGIPPLEPSG